MYSAYTFQEVLQIHNRPKDNKQSATHIFKSKKSRREQIDRKFVKII